MKRLLFIILMLVPALAFGQVRVLFSHQSVGRHIVAEPGHYTAGLEASQDIRGELDPGIAFWDHDYYNYSTGALLDADGDLYSSSGFGAFRGSSGSSGDVYLPYLLSAFDDAATGDAEAFRDSVSSRFDIVMIKPGYRDIHMNDYSSLAAYKTALNDASDWWHDNNPGKYLVVMSASALAWPDDVEGTVPTSYTSAGWEADTPGYEAAEAAVTAYREFDLWMQNEWVCRHPENRYFSTWYMTVEPTGVTGVQYFMEADYLGSDHHLNSTGSNAIQAALVTFVNELAEDFEDETAERRRMTDIE